MIGLQCSNVGPSSRRKSAGSLGGMTDNSLASAPQAAAYGSILLQLNQLIDNKNEKSCQQKHSYMKMIYHLINLIKKFNQNIFYKNIFKRKSDKP